MFACGGRQRDDEHVTVQESVGQQASTFECGGRRRDDKLLTMQGSSWQQASTDMKEKLGNLENAVVSLQKQVSDSQGEIVKVLDMVKTVRDDQEKHWVSNQTGLDGHAMQIESGSTKSDQDKEQMSTQRDVEALKLQVSDKLSVFASVQSDIASLVIRLDQVESKLHLQQNTEDAAKQLIDSLVMPRLQDLRQELQYFETRQQQFSANDVTKPVGQDIGMIRTSQEPSPPSAPLPCNTDVNVDDKPVFEVAPPLVSSALGGEYHGVVKAEETNQRSFASRLSEGGMIDEATINYSFQESIWDVSTLIGVDDMHLGGSVFSLFMLLMNIAVQFLYTVIIMQEFTQTEFDDDTIDGFRSFRVQTAHKEQYFDLVSMSSLATRVCNGDAFAVVAERQANAVQLIDSYMPDPESNRFLGEMQGQVMVALALITWCLAVSLEVRIVLDAALAFLSVWWYRGGQATEFHLDGDGVLRILLFSRFRLICIGLMIVVRFSIAIFLLVAGIFFLVRTTDLRDLVMNAVALQFVLELDELMYAALAPLRIRSLITSLEPLPKLPLCLWQGLDFQAIFHTMWVSVALALAIPMLLLPEVTNLRRARDELCKGNKEFVFAVPHFPPYFRWATTDLSSTCVIGGSNASSTDTMQQEDDFHLRIVTDIIEGTNSDVTAAARMPALFGGSWALQATAGWPVEVAGVKNNYGCEDMMNSNNFDPQNVKNIISFARPWAGPNASSCSDYYRFCNCDSNTGEFARMACPVTCGCSNATSDLMLSMPSLGCPSSCTEQMTFVDSMNISCVEKNPIQLSSYLPWLAYADNLVDMANQSLWPQIVVQRFGSIRDLMKTLGCGVIQAAKNMRSKGEPLIDLCDENILRQMPFKSLRHMCPLSCNCSTRQIGDRMYCPAQCFAQ